MPYVVSTLAAGMSYTTYKKGANGKQIATGEINVKGGADVADKRTLVTPQGVVTAVTAKEAELLKSHPVFKAHQEAGMVKILASLPKDPDKAAADQNRDESGQVTPEDYRAEGKTPPSSGKVDE
ncbi:hypothetical protein LJC36_00220 [Desulfovibrio sp. OttesenSCG-928-C14]|nr:hypothetical protein [Desulfovibrio sp. OttesenSCG-928-C14]